MMQGMMPKTGAATTYKANAGTNPFMGLLSLLMGGLGGG